MSDDAPPRLSARKLAGIALKLGLFAALIYFGGRLGDYLSLEFTPALTPSTEPAIHRIIMVSLAVYVVLMMLPFVPGVEIGLSLMVVLGNSMVPVVWGATVLALSLSFLLGTMLPERLMIRLAQWLGLRRLAAMLREVEARPREERLDIFLAGLSQRWARLLFRNRILLIVVAVNLPGNAVVGGGGGIALTAGFSRLFSFPAFLFAIAVGTAPVPIAMLIAG